MLGDWTIIIRDRHNPQRLLRGHCKRVVTHAPVSGPLEWEISLIGLEEIAEVPLYEED